MTKLQLITRNLLGDLKRLTAEADTVYWMTAFLMKSGVKEVLPVLQEAALRGADIKIVTGSNIIPNSTRTWHPSLSYQTPTISNFAVTFATMRIW